MTNLKTRSKTSSKVIAACLFIALTVNACGQSIESSGSSSSGGLSWPDGSGRFEPSGRLLFQTKQNAAELSAMKASFLQTTPIQQPVFKIDRYNINSVRGSRFQPKSPIVHAYHQVGVLAPLVVALPESFRWNIPDKIRDQLSLYNIDELDILFTPQNKIRDSGSSLKAAFWMFPNRPALDQIIGAPPEYQKTVLLGLFDSDHPIDGQVVTGKLEPFSVSLHDGLVSPDTGHIHTAAAPPGSFSFYSIAIFEEQRRAAVTLHWMLTQADLEVLINQLKGTQVEGAVNNFEALIQTMNHPASPFFGTSMLKKLMDLVTP